MISVDSLRDFKDKSAGQNRYFLLLYKPGSEISDCAYKALLPLAKQVDDVPMYVADVSKVRDIHSQFGITSAPALLVFEAEKHINTIKGCHATDHYQSIFNNAVYQAKAEAAGKKAKTVTVYSTPTCTWCNTLKTWLQKHNIYFTDIDVSKNQSAAEELVNRTGQQGVPQTDIDGEFVVGFDQNKLKKLLEI